MIVEGNCTSWKSICTGFSKKHNTCVCCKKKLWENTGWFWNFTSQWQSHLRAVKAVAKDGAENQGVVYIFSYASAVGYKFYKKSLCCPLIFLFFLVSSSYYFNVKTSISDYKIFCGVCLVASLEVCPTSTWISVSCLLHKLALLPKLIRTLYMNKYLRKSQKGKL